LGVGVGFAVGVAVGVRPNLNPNLNLNPNTLYLKIGFNVVSLNIKLYLKIIL